MSDSGFLSELIADLALVLQDAKIKLILIG